jgi:hypothetical protein
MAFFSKTFMMFMIKVLNNLALFKKTPVLGENILKIITLVPA